MILISPALDPIANTGVLLLTGRNSSDVTGIRNAPTTPHKASREKGEIIAQIYNAQ